MGSFEEGSAAPGPFLLPSVLTAGLLLYIFFFFFFKCLFVQVELAGAGVSGRALCAHPDLEAARGEQGEPPVMTCGRRPLLLLSLQGPAQAGTPFWHCRRRALAQFSSEGRKPKRQLRARGSGGASCDRHRAQPRAVGADGKEQRRLLASIPCKYPAPWGARPRPPGAAGTRIALVLN